MTNARVHARDQGLDAIRIVASLMVVVIHVVASDGFYSFPAVHWQAFNCLDSASRALVPLFFMVTGALLIPRQTNLRDTIKRVLWIVVVLAASSCFYMLWQYAEGARTLANFSPTAALRGPVAFHLWYFYSLIGLLLFLPLLQAFYNHAPNELHFLLIAAAGAASVFNFLEQLGYPKLVGVDLSYFLNFGIYAFLGALLVKQNTTRTAGISGLCLYVVASGLIAYGTWSLSVAAGKPVEHFYSYTEPLVAVQAASAFIAIRWMVSALDESLALRTVAANTLGIYVLHVFVMNKVFFDLGMRVGILNPWLSLPLVSIVIWTISLVLSAALRSAWLAALHPLKARNAASG